MPNTLPAFLSRKQITAQVRTADVPVGFVGGTWFPIEAVDSDEFESLILVDEMHLAPFVHIDAETPRMSDDITGAYQWSVAYIRFKKAFKESDLRIFHEPGVTDPNTLTAATATAAETKIRRYIDNLSVSIDARLEWMFTSAIDGSLAYNDQNVQYTVAYDGAFIGANRMVPGTTWEDGAATPVTDLSNWIETLSDEANHDSWTLIGSRKVLGALARNDQIGTAWSVNVANPAFEAPPSLNPSATQGVQSTSANTTQIQVALGLLGINNVISYNTRYSVATGGAYATARDLFRFTDDRDIWLLPTGMDLGRIATAPASPNDYASGKFGWRKDMEDPWVIEVGAGMYAFIDFPGTQWNKLLQARVLP